MINKKIILWSFVNSFAALIYVSAVALLMTNAEKFSGQPKNIVTPIAFLLLFVLSAAITGSLILGRPVFMYANGDKKGSVVMFATTLGWLFVYTLIAMISNFI